MSNISVTFSTKTLWTILAIVVGVFVAWKLKNFIMIVLVSVIIASFVEGGTRALKKFKIPRTVSAIFFFLLGFTIFFGALYLVVPLFIYEISDFIALFPENSQTATLLGAIAKNGITLGTLQSFLTGDLISGGSSFVATISQIFGGLLNALLVIIISFYLSVQEKGVEQFIRVVFPASVEEYAVDVWQRVERKIGYWFGGQALVALLVALITYVGLILLGVPYALILGTVAGLFVFVPFGSGISMIPTIAIGYLAAGIPLVIKIAIFYAIVHYIESYFISPYVIHRTIGIPMLVILLAFIACVELFGIIGLVVAIPIAVLILELVFDQVKLKKKGEN